MRVDKESIKCNGQDGMLACVMEEVGVETTSGIVLQQKGPAPRQCGMGVACSSGTKVLWSKAAT